MTNEDEVIYEGKTYSAFSSSNVQSFNYDHDSQELYVDFIGGSYVYYGVPPDVVVDFMHAGSKGKFHAREIKNVYSYSKV